jgi:epoxide hydrolase-like predicted phosphatase
MRHDPVGDLDGGPRSGQTPGTFGNRCARADPDPDGTGDCQRQPTAYRVARHFSPSLTRARDNPPVPIQAVVFDIGGVLEFTPPTGWQARWAQRLGLSTATFDERARAVFAPGAVGAASLEEIERCVADEFALGETDLSALMEDVWAEYVGTLNHELAGYFAGLRPRLKTGILSNSFVGAREREQALYGFEDMCDVIVYSHEVGWCKPDPRIYHAVCERLGTTPEDTMLLDDVPANIDGARAVGMHGVVFTDTAQAISELESLGGIEATDRAPSTCTRCDPKPEPR